MLKRNCLRSLVGSHRIIGEHLSSKDGLTSAMAENEFDFVDAGRALRRFFQSRGMPEPEDSAQEAIARLLEKWNDIVVASPEAYLKGIARNMVKDHFKHVNMEVHPIVPTTPPVDERLLRCLERCEKKLLNQREQKLLKDWYSGDGGEKIAKRRHLAEEAGTTLDALKATVHRLRQKIAPCVRKCREALKET